MRSVINDTRQNVYICLCNKDREQCLVSFHQRAQKDGRVFGFRTRKEYSEAEAGPQPGGGHGSQGEFHSLNRILNIQ